MSDRSREKVKVKHAYDNTFNENSPRPPVPGEEREYCVNDWSSPMEWVRHKVPSPVPKKHKYPAEVSSSMGFDPEGNSRSRPSSRHDRPRTPCDSASPPACLRWACSLYQLLEDPDGVQLFRQYLKSEGQSHADALDFWFACEGLRNQSELERVQQIIKAIYKRFFLKSSLPISEELRREVARQVKSSSSLNAPVALFDEAQAQVESLISKTTYPNFLKSEIYLHHVQTVQNPTNSSDFSSSSSSSSSSISTRDPTNLASSIGPLPTLHEDMEFVPSFSAPLSHAPGTACMSTGYHTPNMGVPVRLTKDILLVTQRRRALDVRPKPEAFAGDGRSVHRSSRRQAALQSRQMQELAALNRETNMHQTLIPRTQRLDSRQYQAMDPKKYADMFAPMLIEKLEKVKREQESQELLNRKLMEGDTPCLEDKTRISNLQSRELANAIREKLQVDDDNDQDILDQHVSRVFSDLTPARSPGITSPSKPRWTQEVYQRPRRKEKDGFSTFSSDSGNVHDFPEGHMVKSKSVPDYGDERDRFVRGTSRRSLSKKTLTDLTDSGVSVVSDTPPVTHPALAKDSRVLAWIMESDKGGRGVGHTHSEMSGKHGRYRKTYSGSRSSSLERGSVSGSLGPAQPFVADPSMPPLPLPNTSIQLEEARRRLEDDVRTRSRQRCSNKYFPDMAQSSQSTLRKSTRGPKSAGVGSEDVTTVVFSFCDEQFPYRVKIPGRQITLRQFKEYLPKKGNYRYFFKTECEDLDNQIIQEEVSNDSDIVPLLEGKIMAQVKPID
ncbi:axin-1 isoform X2 [Agrilus planipennis]|uniref:Axin-1 isoform X2 n=1 Tax=Agrilus planipennis TaxID=224129 RepID=A0A7F5R355_AGRPL|nr:axin-1 isoform X2 [Agrilus planipennis]